MIGQLRTALTHPGYILPHLKYSIYPKYLKPPIRKPLAIYEIQGTKMYLDTTDLGLSRTLAKEGVREPHTTEAYKQALGDLSNVTDSITILDAGANIGYYVVIAADVIPDASIIAVEMDPRNASLLKKNVELNDLTDRTIVEVRALGDTSDSTVTATRSPRGNRTNLVGVDEQGTSTEFETRMTTGDALLKEHGVVSDSVNVLRMDVEGYEGAILEGLTGVLSGTQPLVVNIEIHPTYMSDSDISQVVSNLQDAGLRIRNAAQGPRPASIDGFDDELPAGLGLVVAETIVEEWVDLEAELNRLAYPGTPTIPVR